MVAVMGRGAMEVVVMGMEVAGMGEAMMGMGEAGMGEVVQEAEEREEGAMEMVVMDTEAE